MGPLLWKDDYSLYWPGDVTKTVVPNYYSSEYTGAEKHLNKEDKSPATKTSDEKSYSDDEPSSDRNEPGNNDSDMGITGEPESDPSPTSTAKLEEKVGKERQSELKAIDSLPWAHPRRLWATFRLVFFYGITRDVIGHQSKGLDDVHRRAPQFDNKVEHLWTTAQVCSAIIMSIAHGANDVSNAIGPFTTEYVTWKTGVSSAETDTPTWIKAVGGLGLGVGFWVSQRTIFTTASKLTDT